MTQENPSFAQFALDPRIQQAIAEMGYVTPTPIQVQAIPVVLAGQDVMGLRRLVQAKRPDTDYPLCSVC